MLLSQTMKTNTSPLKELYKYIFIVIIIIILKVMLEPLGKQEM